MIDVIENEDGTFTLILDKPFRRITLTREAAEEAARNPEAAAAVLKRGKRTTV